LETKATQQQTIREYLLGRLPSEQQAQFEELLFTNDEVYEELVMAEDELVDEYLRAELPASDLESFVSHFIAAPEHQAKLRFARTLRKYVAAEGSEYQVATDERVADVPPTKVLRTSSRWLGFLPIRNPVFGYAMTAVVLLVLVGVSWIGWRNLNSGPRDSGPLLSFVLTPGLSRGEDAGSNRLRVSADTGTIRFQLLLPEDRYESYEAALDAEGRTLTTKSNLPKELVNGQPAVVLEIPARLVSAGDYRVKLSGVNRDGNSESVASYSFRIQNP